MIRRCVAGMVGLVVLVAVTSAAPKGESGQAPKHEEADFTGKVVAIKLKKSDDGTYLDKVQVKHLGDRAFLVGQFVAFSDDLKVPEMTYWFPVDDIAILTVYKNAKEARKAFEAIKAYRDKHEGEKF